MIPEGVITENQMQELLRSPRNLIKVMLDRPLDLPGWGHETQNFPRMKVKLDYLQKLRQDQQLSEDVMYGFWLYAVEPLLDSIAYQWEELWVDFMVQVKVYARDLEFTQVVDGQPQLVYCDDIEQMQERSVELPYFTIDSKVSDVEEMEDEFIRMVDRMFGQD